MLIKLIIIKNVKTKAFFIILLIGVQMKKRKNKQEFCRILKCFNFVNNSYKKWEMDLCTFHLIEFIKWFNRDEKINAVFDKFYVKWEIIKNTNQHKVKKRIWKKIKELEIYFQKQKKIGIEFEKNNIKK